MTHTDIIAVEKFATELKKGFPIIEQPHSYREEFQNISNKHSRSIIDIALENAQEEFNAQAELEAQANEH